MSRFIEALSEVGQQSPASMGFGPASKSRSAPPQIMLVARVLTEDLEKDASLAEANVDAFLLGPPSAEGRQLDAAAKKIGKRPWGVRLDKFSAKQVSRLIKKGCDFIVFESMDTDAAVLNEEDLGTVVTLSHELGEEVIRSICELPVDAALFSPAQRTLPLTIDGLAKIQLVRGLTDKPFIVEAPEGLGQVDLEALRNQGIAAIIVDAPPLDRVAKVREAIDSLPPRKSGPSQRDALIPYAAAGQGSDVDIPDEGDDEDYDDDF